MEDGHIMNGLQLILKVLIQSNAYSRLSCDRIGKEHKEVSQQYRIHVKKGEKLGKIS